MDDVDRSSSSLRLVAVFEASKGLLVLAAGFGLLAVVQGNARHAAEVLLAHLHLNPRGEIERVFLDAATSLRDGRLWLFATGASAYAVIRLAEAFGLWRGRAWAEWLGAVSGSIYIPFEVLALVETPGGTPLAFLVVNVAVVAFLARRLWLRRAAARI